MVCPFVYLSVMVGFCFWAAGKPNGIRLAKLVQVVFMECGIIDQGAAQRLSGVD
jgi:hypothetical protein